ncbi:MAG TPA: hypothetical protein VGN28_14770 [Blastococcus sp.]|nr:hypothetical protein [Blastococcus sp.]
MIVAAGLLVLLGLGLFVAGIVTGVTVLYWACVAACVVAAVLLVLVRRQGATPAAATVREPATGPAATPPTGEAGEPGPVQATARRETAGAPDAPVPARAEAADTPTAEETPDPGVEEVEVTDLLVVVDLTDEVLVVDEHPRYHVAECGWLAGRETIPLPLDEARTDGFTPCAVCSPDRTLAERARSRQHPAG